MLRAITAGWHRNGAADRDALLRVLDALGEPPVYYLPHAMAGHSRHYVPLGGLKSGKPEKTLMLDSFLALESDKECVATAYVAWPHAALAAQERAVLERACTAIGYLGRAESWCAITVVDAPEERDGIAVVDLASRTDGAGPIARRLVAGPELRGTGLLRSLSETTGAMRRARRLVPPGTVWIGYRLPADYLMVREQYAAREHDPVSFGPTILRFTVERTASSVLPPVTQAVSIAEVMRRAAMRRYSDLSGGTATTRLAGKSDEGSARREGHDHPFYLPIDSHESGRVDRIDVWFPQGCTHAEYRAVTSIDALRDRFAFDGELALTYLGSVEAPRGRIWTTATPVVLDRFPKVRGVEGHRHVVDAPDEQLHAMIERRIDESCDIELWPQTETVPRPGSHGTRLDAFRRARRGERPTHPVVGATLRFEHEVRGPIVLGRLAHFGLGQFAPVG
jgi:CRISPR-associated protein Csb2